MRISFNDWLTGTNHDDPNRHMLAKAWVPRRGRLTRDSVEKRATLEYGEAPGVGAAAWDAYLKTCCLPSPQPSTTETPPT